MSDVLVSGLTIVRNGARLNYPFIEAIRSALPICDEYIVVVGDSDDATLDLLADLKEPRIRIIHTLWSPYVTPQKCLLAQQTNIGLGFCRGRWCLYLQANEVLHEESLPRLRGLMEQHVDSHEVEAMLVERLTLWSDYDHYVPVYPRRFKWTPRIVRPNIGTYSIRDAMSFAVFDGFSTHGRYPRSIDTGIDLFRYGYVHSVTQQALKFSNAVHKKGVSEEVGEDYHYQYYPRQFIAPYAGPHPAVMADRIMSYPEQDKFDLARCRTRLTPGERKRLLESYFLSRGGLQNLGRNRFKLVGKMQPKPRPSLNVLTGTTHLV